ncbi:MAG: hypothetical protein WC854_11990 [Bacteroidales bacterium]
MERRQKDFIEKFSSASRILNTAPEDIISIKLREADFVRNYRDYDKLFEQIKLLSHANINHLQGNFHSTFQGDAYIVVHSNEKVIIVKHETGLEILYIAGSIASLLGIIPLIIKIWKKTGDYYSRNIRNTEIRFLDHEGKLIEEKDVRFLNEDKDNDFRFKPNRKFERLEEGNLIAMDLSKSHEDRINILEQKMKTVIKNINAIKKKLKN